MPFSTIFFDLDDTLYPSDNGLWEAIRQRMTLYMVERLKIPKTEVDRIRRTYFEQYGTTLRGLQHHYEIDSLDFLAFVHDLPVAEFIPRDTDLRGLLGQLPQKKYIFTNADAAHARRVLAALDLASYFDGIIDVVALNFSCKPTPAAYQTALSLAGEIDPQRCIYLDDSPRNLMPARQMGFFTVLVGSAVSDPSAVVSIASLLDLPQLLPELFDEKG